MAIENKTNYKAWEIRLEDFPETKSLEEQIKFLLSLSILAPSAHNSQPWNFILKEATLKIKKDSQRLLKENDTEGRQTLTSFGCLLENILLAADYFGFVVDSKYFPNSLEPELIAELNFKRARQKLNEKRHLVNFINKRRTSRSEYLTDQIPNNLINELEETVGTSCKVDFLTDNKKKQLAEIMVNAQVSAMENLGFRMELSHYIKSSATSSSYGMPGFTLEMPFLISFIAPNLIKKINMSKVGAKKDLDLLTKHTPIIVVFSSVSDTKEQWIEIGKTLEKFWLKCTSLGLSCSLLAAAVQMPKFRSQAMAVLNTKNFPQVILRCGFSKKQARHSPRFALNQLILK